MKAKAENQVENELELEFLREIVYKAGDVALNYFGKDYDKWVKHDSSPVTEADLAVNKFLEQNLRTKRPHYGWVSEESEAQISAYRNFIIDPIDGTRGFLANDDHWCISAAIEEAGRIIAAAIFCPRLQKLFYSYRGGEAFCWDIAQNKISILGKQTGKQKGDIIKLSVHRDILKKLPAKKGYELYPPICSLAYNIILCAEDEVDCILIRPSCKEWDIAAADLILQNSGGMLCCQNQAIIYHHRQKFDNYLFAYKDIDSFNFIASELEIFIR